MAERELWLLRHAKSSHRGDAPSDFDRPLARRGREDAPRLGAWMVAEGLVPDLVVASPARRVRETMDGVVTPWGEGRLVRPIRWEPRVYGARVEDLLAVLRDLPGEAVRVLLAGHNPGLEDLLDRLLGASAPTTRSGKEVTTCGFFRLVAPAATWVEFIGRKTRLAAFWRPRDR